MRSPNVRPRTYDKYISLLSHAKPLYDLKLTNVTSSHIQKLYNSIMDVSGSTKRKIYYCIRVMLQQAVVNQLIHINPCSNVKPPKAGQKEIEIFTDEEMAKIIKNADVNRYSLVIHIAIGTSMRISEILALNWTDIDFKKATITINRTIHYNTLAGIHYCDPKTASSQRTIKINKDMLHRLKEYRLKTADNLLFTTLQGNPLNP